MFMISTLSWATPTDIPSTPSLTFQVLIKRYSTGPGQTFAVDTSRNSFLWPR